jgi:hypothetical protein
MTVHVVLYESETSVKKNKNIGKIQIEEIKFEEMLRDIPY